jgi:hypothetical protein
MGQLSLKEDSAGGNLRLTSGAITVIVNERSCSTVDVGESGAVLPWRPVAGGRGHQPHQSLTRIDARAQARSPGTFTRHVPRHVPRDDQGDGG